MPRFFVMFYFSVKVKNIIKSLKLEVVQHKNVKV